MLTSDTSALVTIKGGSGNSYYDLSSLTLAAAGNTKASFQGGTSTKGNSEIAFNNSVVANATKANLAGTVVNISNIQVLDDTGNPGTPSRPEFARSSDHGQGGIINMADFALAALNVNYDLISGALGNLFSVTLGSVIQNHSFAAGTDVAPAGYQLLQLLNGDGSTENYPGSDLSILTASLSSRSIAGRGGRDRQGARCTGGYTDFGYNGFGRHHSNTVARTGYNITIYGSENPGPSNETLVDYRHPGPVAFRRCITCSVPPEQRPCRFTRWNG